MLVLRDLMFGGKRHFCELLQSDEHISSNILADRLARLVENGVLSRADDPSHKQKAIDSLTEKGIALLPIIVQIGRLGLLLDHGCQEARRRLAQDAARDPRGRVPRVGETKDRAAGSTYANRRTFPRRGSRAKAATA